MQPASNTENMTRSCTREGMRAIQTQVAKDRFRDRPGPIPISDSETQEARPNW